MTKYKVSYWERESVWVRRTIEVESETKPTEKNIEYIIVNNPTVEYFMNDYAWETSEHEEYDFDTDFEVEEA